MHRVEQNLLLCVVKVIATQRNWSIMFDDGGHLIDADEHRRQVIEQRCAELQQKRVEALEQKQKERLNYALQVIRDHGGSISRKQLTEILIKKFEIGRTTATTFMSSHIGSSFYEVNGMIQTSPDMTFDF